MHDAPACAGARVLVEIPFTAADVPLLLRTHAVWSQFAPCASTSQSASAGLLFLFNGRCEADKACGRVQQFIQSIPTSVRGCFGDIRLRDARLSGRADVYDKQRRSAKWSAGPNNVFYRATAMARHSGYTHLLQMEPDVLPFRVGWLDRAHCIAALSEAWVIGSALQANCTREETTGQCVALPDDIAEHINGNALYAVGESAFMSYLHETRQGKLGRMPFDLALHLLHSQYPQSKRRQLVHRFQHSSFVLNFGTSLPAGGAALRDQHAGAFLVHSSALAKLDAEALQAYLRGAAEAPARRIDGAANSPHDAPVNLELGPLRERAASLGGQKVAVVTFVAGSRYRSLCRNHVMHLRRAGVSNYVLVALDTLSVQWLRGEQEPVIDASHLVRGIPEGGADRFGTSAFFAINGGRYRALIAMLQSGVSLFVLDLDAVVLSNPLTWLGHEGEKASSTDLLVQSDARDGTTALELDPDLLGRRLGMHGASNWTYVNGGIFFSRACPATVALFQRVWEQLSKSETPPNEQDMLNRELAAGRIRWGLLPPARFPNGFVHFLRPISSTQQPVLVHANWINGIEAKIYHLREAGLWALGGETVGEERFLSIGDGTYRRLGFATHRRALRDALAIAHALNRTLVLPQLPVSSTSGSRTRTIAHYFDYEGFARSFPRHRAHGPREGDGLGAGAVKVHLDVGRARKPPAASGYAVVRVGSSSVDGLNDAGIRKQLAPYSTARLLHLWTPYRRFSGRFTVKETMKDFAARAQHGLKPAPRLQFLVQHVYRAMRRGVGAFDCVDASIDQEFRPLLQGGKSTPASARTLLAAAARSLNGTRVLVIGDGGDDARRALRAEAASALGERALWMEDHVPPWYTADFDTPLERGTHARSLVEMKLCAKAKHFVGSLAAPSTHAVCQMRGRSSQCEDALGRVLPSKWLFF